MAEGFIRGEERRKIEKRLSETMGVARRAAERRVGTESRYFASKATEDAYGKFGVRQFQFLATLDAKTCPVCGDLGGQVFDMKDYMIGVNAPPIHLNDRCTTTPYLSDLNEMTGGGRPTRNGEGRTVYEVDGDMTYKAWRDKYAAVM